MEGIMTYYRAKIEETLVTYLEFGEDELEGEDPETAAFEIAQSLSRNDWEIQDSWVDLEEFEGELPEIG